MRKVPEIMFYIVLFVALVIVFGRALGEDGWIMCQPDSYVNVRASPSKRGRICGYVELGQPVQTGKQRNGYTYVSGISNESGDGWIASGYIVTDQPQIETVNAWIDAAGRVACRRAVNGNRRKWLHQGDELTLYASSAEWSVTSEGFIRTEFIMAER